MGKCNLFRNIDNNTGTFLTFSQFAEDLTKSDSQKDTYRVVPSKFICLKLNNPTLQEGDNNTFFPQVLQDQFENSISIWRGKESAIPSFSPIFSQEKLWDTLIKNNYITVNANYNPTDNTVDYYDCDNIVYVGDINIYNYNDFDGIGYNEIYCHIPSEAKKQNVKLGFRPNQLDSVTKFYFENDYIDGYSAETTPQNALSTIAIPDGEDLGGKYYTFNSDTDVIITDIEESSGDVESFEFDCIIVLYDIYTKSINTTSTDAMYAISNIKTVGGENEAQLTNIPMGIYITGMFGEEEISNKVIKYINSSDIYGQGTSYGLRICNRYISTSNATVIQSSLAYTDGTDDVVEGYISLMEAYRDTYKELKSNLDKLNEYTNDISEHWSSFKDSRTNVPYIVTIDKVPYWFVNGRNTGQRAGDQNAFIQEDNGKVYFLDSAGQRILIFDRNTGQVNIPNIDITNIFVDGKDITTVLTDSTPKVSFYNEIEGQTNETYPGIYYNSTPFSIPVDTLKPGFTYEYTIRTKNVNTLVLNFNNKKDIPTSYTYNGVWLKAESASDMYNCYYDIQNNTSFKFTGTKNDATTETVNAFITSMSSNTNNYIYINSRSLVLESLDPVFANYIQDFYYEYTVKVSIDENENIKAVINCHDRDMYSVWNN